MMDEMTINRGVNYNATEDLIEGQKNFWKTSIGFS